MKTGWVEKWLHRRNVAQTEKQSRFILATRELRYEKRLDIPSGSNREFAIGIADFALTSWQCALGLAF